MARIRSLRYFDTYFSPLQKGDHGLDGGIRMKSTGTQGNETDLPDVQCEHLELQACLLHATVFAICRHGRESRP